MSAEIDAIREEREAAIKYIQEEREVAIKAIQEEREIAIEAIKGEREKNANSGSKVEGSARKPVAKQNPVPSTNFQRKAKK